MQKTVPYLKQFDSTAAEAVTFLKCKSQNGTEDPEEMRKSSSLEIIRNAQSVKSRASYKVLPASCQPQSLTH